jgi:23S rRNA pseudouridine1911/1915/1917 synthase
VSDPTVREEVPAALDGERIDRVVALLLDCSRQEAAALLAAGDVQVGGRAVAKGSHRLHQGDVLEVLALPEVKDHRPLADPSVAVVVVHEDDDVVVVDKQAGLVVHPGSGHEQATLVHGLLARFPELAEVGEPDRPGIVHRLDGGTSGLLVVARTPVAYGSLTEQLGERSVDRRYDALVWGHPEAEAGLIDAPIGRSPRRRTAMAVSADGREARTRYEVVHRYAQPEVALLSCTLETGRTHQIRVHLQAIGHAVVGDDRYRGMRPALAVARPLLHAAHLGFEHPTSGERLSFDAPRPDDFEQVVERLAADDEAPDPPAAD